jgi:CheY-like chemotaxis protein
LVAHVLVVDDDDDGRSALVELLEDQGFEVAEANDGRRALDHLVSRAEPSLVILDLEMPVMSGFELLDTMKRYTRLARVPVLVVSGTKSSERPLHDSVIGYMAKPIDVDVLLDKVRACVVDNPQRPLP